MSFYQKFSYVIKNIESCLLNNTICYRSLKLIKIYSYTYTHTFHHLYLALMIRFNDCLKNGGFFVRFLCIKAVIGEWSRLILDDHLCWYQDKNLCSSKTRVPQSDNLINYKHNVIYSTVFWINVALTIFNTVL